MTTTDPYASLRADLTGQPPAPTAVFPPGHPDAPPTTAPAPPGMIWTLLPNGDRVLAYLPPGYDTPPAGAPGGAPAVAAERDKWPARLLTGGGAAAAVLGVIGHYGPGLSQAGHAAEMTGIGIAATAAGAGVLISLVKGSLTNRTPVSVTVNNTVAPTLNATATARSRSRGR